jgi:hypothetical protein
MDRRMPPGLCDSDGVETATASRERRRVSLAARAAVQEVSALILGRLDNVFGKLEELAKELSNCRAITTPPRDLDELQQRLDRLEILAVCSPAANPTIDEVLSEALARSKDFGEIPAESPSVLGQVTFQGEEVPGKVDLPFVPAFPYRTGGDVNDTKCKATPNNHLSFDIHSNFDIFDSSEDAEVQTNVALVSRSSQTCAMPKLRKSRCHGRASQTDTSVAGVSELGVTDSQEVSSVSTAGCRGMFTGPWLQLPHDDWQSIHTKFPKKCSRFGFSVGELVGWVTSDSDVPLGSRGKVIGFSEDAVEVAIAGGEYCFPPDVLYRVGENVQGVRGFKLGDLVEWTTRDSYVSCVSQGQAGVVTGSQLQKMVIDFGKGQHLSLEPADVQVLT